MDDELKTFLKTSLENDNNKCILNLTTSEIKDTKNEILEALSITKREINELKKKLKEYRYIDELQELHIGSYIRWIKYDSTDTPIKLTNGGLLLDVIFEDSDLLQIKNNMNRIFTINIDDNLIFQKLTNQEKIILYAIDNIDKIK